MPPRHLTAQINFHNEHTSIALLYKYHVKTANVIVVSVKACADGGETGNKASINWRVLFFMRRHVLRETAAP